jgi:glucoamylase
LRGGGRAGRRLATGALGGCLDWRLALARAGLVLGAVALAVGLLSGGTRADPRTPPALPGLPPPFLVTAVVGHGGRTVAVDAYGDVVGLWAPGPAGEPLIHNPVERQAAGSVAADTGVVARARLGRRWVPFWRADAVAQRYLPGTNVLRTVAWFGERRAVVVRSVGGAAAARADRHWLRRARPLGGGAPGWARAMYRRSLLALRALTDRRSGAVAAGPRDGWAYVWPRDASAVAIAFAAAGYRPEASRVVGFLRRLDLDAAARFHGSGEPVEGRAAQGDAAGWVAAAAAVAGSADERSGRGRRGASAIGDPWRGRADYQEGATGDFLGNAIASAASPREIRVEFAIPAGLVREAGDPASGLDSTAAWAVRPFPQPALFPLARRTLLRLAAASTRFGIVPSEGWAGGGDPWTAPTAWSAWSLAALGERAAALRLIAELRRAATPAGLLPERVDIHSGIPRSTAPLAWSHAFVILALRQLWPGRPLSRPGS